MARVVVGTVMKRKDGKGDTIKLASDVTITAFNGKTVTLKAGDYMNLEDEKTSLNGIDYAVQNGKLAPENAEKARERVQKTPWLSKEKKDGFVRYEITVKG